MKKILLYTIAIVAFMSLNTANATETVSDEKEININIEIPAKSTTTNAENIDNNESEKNTPQSIVLTPLNAEKTEFKFILDDKVGYLNKNTNVKFLTTFDDIILFDKYIKVKKGDYFGLVDKNGKILIPVQYQKIGISVKNNQEYLLAQFGDQYIAYSTDGEPISENELVLQPNNYTRILASAIRPEFLTAYINQTKEDNTLLYEKKKAEAVINQTEPDEIEIEEIALPGRYKVASIEKNVKEVIPKRPIYTKTFSVGNKRFEVNNVNGKYGLNGKNKEMILPAVYDYIDSKDICKHYDDPVILTKRNNAYAAYNLKGKLMAEQVYDKVNVYSKRSVYSVSFNNNMGMISRNGKIVGFMTMDNNNYKVENKSIFATVPHKVSQLMKIILSAK